MRNISIAQIEYLVWQDQIRNTLLENRGQLVFTPRKSKRQHTKDSGPQLSCSEATKVAFPEVSWTTLKRTPRVQENKSCQITSFLLLKYALNSPKIMIKLKRQ